MVLVTNWNVADGLWYQLCQISVLIFYSAIWPLSAVVSGFRLTYINLCPFYLFFVCYLYIFQIVLLVTHSCLFRLRWHNAFNRYLFFQRRPYWYLCLLSNHCARLLGYFQFDLRLFWSHGNFWIFNRQRWGPRFARSPGGRMSNLGLGGYLL